MGRHLMSMNIQKMIRTPLVEIIVILGFVGCAGSTKAPQGRLALEPPGDVNTTAGGPPGDVEPVASEAQSPRQPRHLVHRVRWSGESLSLIAKWYTGKLNNWKILADFNPKLKPDRIFVGEEILVPEGLLKTRKPMPRSFVGQFARKSKKKTSPPAKGDTDLPLFGPRDYSSK
jgi:hypothetical protein